MKWIAAISFSLTLFAALAQNSVQGHVIDGETNTPLPGANVFIAKTTYGTSTAADGSFIINGLAPAHYQLVVSFIGYGTQAFDVVPGQQKTYKVILKPDTKTLNEVVVHGRKRSRNEWLENFKIFKERFIGLSDNARLCSFENPRVLDFVVEDGILKAKADSVLILNNKGLGYRIKILLEKYEFNMVTFHIHYEGHIVYQPLVPENEEEKLEWARNRLKAYYGSEMHFLRCLYRQSLIENGYYFNIVKEENVKDRGVIRHGIADTTLIVRSPIYNGKKIKMLTILNYQRLYDSLSYVENPEQPTLKFNGELEVKYIMEAESGDYQLNRKRFPQKVPQESWIKLLKPCIIQPHGEVYPQDAVETRNYWSWELMAESLPFDYNPAPDKQLLGITDYPITSTSR